VRYAIVIENAGSNYSAYVPDLPGCIATGETVAEAERLIREAIEFHLEGLRADGTPIPPRHQAAWTTSKSRPERTPSTPRGADLPKPGQSSRATHDPE